MQNSMWKLATLLGVIGVGCLVVMQLQRGLPDKDKTAAIGDLADAKLPGNDDPYSVPGVPGMSKSQDTFDDIRFAGGPKLGADSDEFDSGSQFEPDAFNGSDSVMQTAYQEPPEQAEPMAGGFDDPGVGFGREPVQQQEPRQEVAADDIFGDGPFGNEPDPAATTGRATLSGEPKASQDPAPELDLFESAGDIKEPKRLFDEKTPGIDDGPAVGAPQAIPDPNDLFGDDAFGNDSVPPAEAQTPEPAALTFDDDPAPLQPTPAQAQDNGVDFGQMNNFGDPDPLPVRRQPGISRFEGDLVQEPELPMPSRSNIPDLPDIQPEPTLPQPRRSAEWDNTPSRISVTSGSRFDEKSLDMVPHGTLRPQLRIEKTAPTNASIGKPLIYHILIRNVGNAVANEVIVEDRIPAGAEMKGSIPQAELIDGRLTWRFRELAPQAEKKIAIRVIPKREGQLGSVATVNFKAEIGSRTTITAPRLVFKLEGQKEAKMGETVVFRYRVENVGSGDASNVWIRNPLPSQLQHPEGGDLEYKVGDLPSGKSREITLRLVAAGPGEITNRAVVTADGGVKSDAEARVDIMGAQLRVQRRGPKRRYLGRPAIYENVVTNETHRDATDAQLIEYIPRGMEVVNVSNGGQFDPNQRLVSWRLPRIEARGRRVLKVELKPIAAGDHESLVEIRESAGFKSNTKSMTRVEHLNNIGLQLSELSGTVAVGERMVFTVVVRNRGTSAASNVQLTLAIPAECDVADAGPLQASRVRGGIQFPAVRQIPAGGSTEFQIGLVAKNRADDVRLRATVVSDQMPNGLKTEESITIYED